MFFKCVALVFCAADAGDDEVARAIQILEKNIELRRANCPEPPCADDDAAELAQLGWLYEKQGRLKRAVKQFVAATAIDPALAKRTHHALATRRGDAGDFVGAAESLDRYTRVRARRRGRAPSTRPPRTTPCTRRPSAACRARPSRRRGGARAPTPPALLLSPGLGLRRASRALPRAGGRHDRRQAAERDGGAPPLARDRVRARVRRAAARLSERAGPPRRGGARAGEGEEGRARRGGVRKRSRELPSGGGSSRPTWRGGSIERARGAVRGHALSWVRQTRATFVDYARCVVAARRTLHAREIVAGYPAAPRARRRAPRVREEDLEHHGRVAALEHALGAARAVVALPLGQLAERARRQEREGTLSAERERAERSRTFSLACTNAA